MSIHTEIVKHAAARLQNKRGAIVLDRDEINKAFKPELDYLAVFFVENKKKIKDLCKYYISKAVSYRLIDFAEDIFLRIKKSDSSKFFLQLGYPFEFASLCISDMAVKGYDLRICLEGERLRSAQRKYLAKFLNCEIIEVENKELFREHVAQLFSKANKIVYMDLFTFIGDSIISTEYLEQFKRAFSFKESAIFSRASQHLCHMYANTYSLDSNLMNNILSNNTLIIMPDVIDTHFITTMDIIAELKKSAVILLLGRNLIIKKGSKNEVIHFNKKDPLLSNNNIGDHERNCLDSFIEPIETTTQIVLGKIDKSAPVLIAPFTSLKDKAFSDELIIDILRRLVGEGFTQILFSCGSTKEDVNKEKLSQLLSKVQLKNLTISLKTFASVSELAKMVLDSNVPFAITADTSIAAVMNSINKLNFTIFMKHCWDLNSIRSFAAESPLGFCAFNSYQIPILFSGDFDVLDGIFTILNLLPRVRNMDPKSVSTLRKFPETNQFLEEYKNKCKLYQKECWKMDSSGALLKMYNPEEFVSIFAKLDMEKCIKLMDSALKISPLVKIYA